MKKKKGTKAQNTSESIDAIAQISSVTELRTFISEVRDRLLKDEAAPIFAMSAMQQVMSLDTIYELLDKQNKEILQEIWVKLSQSGFTLRKPPLLFTEGDVA
jgi:IS30 family transposase